MHKIGMNKVELQGDRPQINIRKKLPKDYGNRVLFHIQQRESGFLRTNEDHRHLHAKVK